MAKVTLDMETFKALASSTRLQVLRALDERRKTLSELAKELDLNKATVHEHLGILLATGLIKKRDDEGRKWIYYELTWQGERLLHPQETTTFAVLLGLGVAAAGGGVFMLGAALNWWLGEQQVLGQGVPEGGSGADGPEAQGAMADAPSGNGTSSDASDQAAPAGGSNKLIDEGEAMPDAGHSDGFFSPDDPDGMIGLLLLVTAALLVFFAFVMRRSRRGSA